MWKLPWLDIATAGVIGLLIGLLGFYTDRKPALRDANDALAALERPRKHYQAYFATSEANGHMWRDPRGVHDFLRAYFHVKSGDWVGNWPFELGSWAAEELARMPDYYIMPLALGMAETVAPEMPSASAIEVPGVPSRRGIVWSSVCIRPM